MQQQSADIAIDAGIPSETHWLLPNGFGSAELPPEESELPEEIGDISLLRFPLRPGLEVYTFSGRIKSALTIQSRIQTGQPYLWLSSNFGGRAEYRQNGSIGGVSATGSCECAMFQDPVTDFSLSPGEYKVTGMLVSPDRLRVILQGQHLDPAIDDFLDGKFDPRVFCSRSALFHNIAQQIINHPYQGVMASVYMEAKALEMLVESMRLLMDDDKSGETGRGRRYVMAARDIIMADLIHPPRIEDVAKQVGLSQRRLNEVFREVFSASPLQCLVQWRLDHARDLLAQRELTIKQVAYLVGYAHADSFRQAFVRQFGYPPSSISEA